MRPCWPIFLVSIALSFAGCTSNNDLVPAEGGQTGPFSLSISVTDSLSRPVNGLQVSVLTWLAGVPSPSAPSARQSHHPLAATTFGYDVASPSRVSLTIVDLDNSPVASIVDQVVTNPGSYLATWSVHQRFPTRVFKCRFFARDTTTGAVLFADSNEVVLWQQDASLAVIGSTSSIGAFTTRDSLLFPNILTLPPLVLTSAAAPAPLGLFSVRDTVTIVLTDTLSQRSQNYQRVIVNGVNTLSLLWTPSAPSLMTKSREIPSSVRSSSSLARKGVAWGLWQNYPNPFN
jgi:hypothetical protein